MAPACRLLEVSRSAYYQWAAHTPSKRERSDAFLTESIKGIHRDSRGTYGRSRVHGPQSGRRLPNFAREGVRSNPS